MSWLKIKVEASPNGIGVYGIIKELCATATRLGLWVECGVDGICVLVPPGASPRMLWESYERGRENGFTTVSLPLAPLPEHD